MALCTGAEDELEYSYQPDEDEEYVCVPCSESTEQEGVEETSVCFPTEGIKQEEEEEMDEEQQVLCEGSLWAFHFHSSFSEFSASVCYDYLFNSVGIG